MRMLIYANADICKTDADTDATDADTDAEYICSAACALPWRQHTIGIVEFSQPARSGPVRHKGAMYV